jgi:FtsP/CotA-like multicopper oxidase with cupredoxin domain
MAILSASLGCNKTPKPAGAPPAPTVVIASAIVEQTNLDGGAVPQFVDPLPTMSDKRVSGSGTRAGVAGKLTVDMEEFRQKVLPSSFYAKLASNTPEAQGTLLWGYNVNGNGPSWPGRTIESQKGIPTDVTYTNSLEQPDGSPPTLQKYLTEDLTLHWADPIGLSAKNGCVQGDEDGGTSVTDPTVIGGTQNAFDPNGPCALPYVGPVPTVPHLHGAEVLSDFDGHPDAWFTPHLKLHGPGYVGNTYHYPNSQEATTLWFHDHALGTTRLNVFSGLAAFYFLRDVRDTGKVKNPIGLPGGDHEQELLIADRSFDTYGNLIFPDGSSGANGPNGFNGTPGNPNLHPFTIPEYFGDVMTVNGKSWPYMAVKPQRYRFRIVNGSNARFLSMQLSQEDPQNPGLATSITDPNGVGIPGPHIWQIGSDGGFLNLPTDVDALSLPSTTQLLNTNPDPPHLFLAPGERADIIIDFHGMRGKRVIMTNFALAPFPNGGAVVETFPGPAGSPQTNIEVTSQIMEFRVDNDLLAETSDPSLPVSMLQLRAAPIPNLRDAALKHPDLHRQLVLDEVEDVASGAPVEVILNNSHWNGLREGSSTPVPNSTSNGHGLLATEAPQVGATELWDVANMTPDAHPVHIHLVQFQVIDVQPFLTEHGLCDQFSSGTQDFADAQEYRPYYDGQFPGGTWGGFSFDPATFIPGYGPPMDYLTRNQDGAVGGNPAFSTVLNGVSSAFVAPPVKPAARDSGWKDTFKMFPCAVTRLAVRWAPQARPAGSTRPGQNDFPFDPTVSGPGYVWHCHILDHEDNEMMRPMLMQKGPVPVLPPRLIGKLAPLGPWVPFASN